MKTTLLRIHTQDGIELAGLLYEPDAPIDKILAHVHGMARSFYEDTFLDHIAATLTGKGIACFFFNNRGCETIKDFPVHYEGKSTLRRIGNAHEQFEECLFDISGAIEAVKARGYRLIHLSGHSLGSAKVAFYAAQSTKVSLQSLILLSPSDMHGLVRMNQERFKEDAAEANDLIARGKGEVLLRRKVWNRYSISANSYKSLFLDSSDAIFNFRTPSIGFDTLQKLALPLCAITGKKDDALTTTIESTMELISGNAIHSPKVKTLILGEANHEFEGSEQELADAMALWITDNS